MASNNCNHFGGVKTAQTILVKGIINSAISKGCNQMSQQLGANKQKRPEVDKKNKSADCQGLLIQFSAGATSTTSTGGDISCSSIRNSIVSAIVPVFFRDDRFHVILT